MGMGILLIGDGMVSIVETTKMSTKGQVIIPKHTREYTRSSDDTNFTVFPLDRETIILKKIDSKKIVEEFRKLRAGIEEKISEEEINEIIHKAR